jgi:hypothetical protein
MENREDYSGIFAVSVGNPDHRGIRMASARVDIRARNAPDLPTVARIGGGRGFPQTEASEARKSKRKIRKTRSKRILVDDG